MTWGEGGFLLKNTINIDFYLVFRSICTIFALKMEIYSIETTV